MYDKNNFLYVCMCWQPRYSCICETGWTSPPGSAACTADIDECSLPNPPCSQNPPVQCINTPGSFTCGPCPAGMNVLLS